MKLLVPIGRVLFCAIFIFSAPAHFTQLLIDYAAEAGTPAPEALVPLSGLLALTGGLLVASGYAARVGAWLLVLFLIPVTATMHDFWNLEGPERATQQIMFMKNLAMLGGALLIAYFGGGPYSLGSRGEPAKAEEVPAEGRAPRRAEVPFE